MDTLLERLPPSINSMKYESVTYICDMVLQNYQQIRCNSKILDAVVSSSSFPANHELKIWFHLQEMQQWLALLSASLCHSGHLLINLVLSVSWDLVWCSAVCLDVILQSTTPIKSNRDNLSAQRRVSKVISTVQRCPICQHISLMRVLSRCREVGAKFTFLLLQLNFDFFASLIWDWLDLRDLAIFDMAVTNDFDRTTWMKSLGSLSGRVLDDWCYNISSLTWLKARNIRPRSIDTITRRLRRSSPAITNYTFDGNDFHPIRPHDLDNKIITDAILTNLAHDCPDLLSVRLCGSITEVGLSALGKGSPHLKSIGLYRCDKINDSGLSALARGCSQLQSVSIYCCSNLTDVGLSVLAEECLQLEFINLHCCCNVMNVGNLIPKQRVSRYLCISLNYCVNVTNEGLCKMVQGCPKLHSLSLNYCRRIKDHGLSFIGQCCPDLRVIDLCGNNITDVGLVALVQGCSLLESVNLYCCSNITFITLSALSTGCSRLQSIKLTGTGITDAGISILAQGCPLLQSIHLESCDFVTNFGLLTLAQKCSKFTAVTISSCCNIRSTGLSILMHRWPRLLSINLSGESITDSVLSALARGCPQLQSLNLYSCHGVTNVGMCALALACPNLQSIEICYSDNIKDASLRAVAQGCHKLQSIYLHCLRNITDSGLFALSRGCPDLSSVRVEYCDRITYAGLLSIVKGCPHLQSIYPQDCRAVGLSFEIYLRQIHPAFLNFKDPKGRRYLRLGWWSSAAAAPLKWWAELFHPSRTFPQF